MKNNFSLRSMVAALLVGASALHASAAISVDTVISGGILEPYAVAVAADGSFYFTDGANHRVMRVPTGLTSAQLLAGQNGVPGSNNGFADAAQFNIPQGLVLARGGVVVADSENHTIRFISFGGAVSNLAGTTGSYGLVNGPALGARFRYPLGLAADTNGNIYVADSQNNCVRKIDVNDNVTTVATGFFQPAGIAVGDNGDLWVTDTRRHVIKRVSTNGTITTVAGVLNVSGALDSAVATQAQFSNPRGLLWAGGNTGLLVTDSGNHTVRRVYWNTNFNTYSVATFAGKLGESGALNGDALAARFNGPVGIAADTYGGGFLVADKGNSQIRRINTGVVQPPVANPTIGWVDFVLSENDYVTQLREVVSSTFNNDVIIAIRGEQGTQTYFTSGTTPSNPFEDNIPSPGAGVGNTPPPYSDGQPASTAPTTILAPAPDITIKAIGTQTGRRSSAEVVARFLFQVANPLVVGDNAASFRVQTGTTNAEIWYTWDGSEPTNNPLANVNVVGPIYSGDSVSFNLGGSNRLFKARAYRSGYRPSDIVTKEFTTTNFVANEISLGFASGEASSAYIAAAGQRFYAPVTLNLLPGQSIYSFQFNVVATNLSGDPIDANQVGFESLLKQPTEVPGVFRDIPAAMSLDGTDNLTSLVVPNPAINLLAVGWVERYLHTNLYNTLVHDLVRYSQAHDTMFNSSGGKVILGGYSFVVPPTATTGQTYQISIGRPSATSDGVREDVYIRVPTNGVLSGVGPINGIKQVTVGSIPYVVGDAAPFRWFNAGDFGEGILLNNDVVQVFQSAVYSVNMPPEGSDFFDVMDASDGTVNDLFAGDIDQVMYGDGVLGVDDVYVVFRRSLDPSLKWFARYWEDGIRKVKEIPNTSALSGPSPAKAKSKSAVSLTGTPTVSISADDVVGAAGSTVQVPVRVRITGGLPIRVAMLSVVVEPLDGAPALTQQVTLTPAAGLGTPSMSSSKSVSEASATWLNNAATGVSGDAVFATLNIRIPDSASPAAAYRVRINHFSASENGIALFRKFSQDGVVSTAPRSGSTLGDSISDVWRLRFFGSASSPASAPNADADNDGVSNEREFRAGTNPKDAASFLRLNVQPSAGSVKLSFPTGLGRSYVLESSSSPNGPWTSISTNAGTGAPREETDTTGGVKFYRVRAQ